MNNLKVLCKVLVLTCMLQLAELKYATQYERQLLAQFKKNGYDKELIPLTRRTGKDKMVIKVAMALESVVEVNEKEQYMVSRIVLMMDWQDRYLRWDPASYDEVTRISMPPSDIWRPDVVLMNVLDDESYKTNLDESTNRVIVGNDGAVEWRIRKTVKTSCLIDIARFPYDHQECEINMASWSYDADVLEFQFSDLDPDVSGDQPFFQVKSAIYVRSNQWHVENLTAAINAEVYSIPMMQWKIHLRRKTLYYKMHLILPTAVLAFVLTLTFILPAASGERLGMSITLLLSQVVFMLVVADMIPRSSENVPVVGQYFTAIFFVMILQIIILCCIMRCYHRDHHDPPVSGCTRIVVLNGLARMFGLYAPKVSECKEHGAGNAGGDVDLDEVKEIVGYNNPMLEQLNKKIDAIAEKLKEDDDDCIVRNEWCIVGATLDRLMFVLFLLTLIILTIVFFVM